MVEQSDTFTNEAYIAAINSILNVIDKNFVEIEARLSKLEELNKS